MSDGGRGEAVRDQRPDGKKFRASMGLGFERESFMGFIGAVRDRLWYWGESADSSFWLWL